MKLKKLESSSVIGFYGVSGCHFKKMSILTNLKSFWTKRVCCQSSGSGVRLYIRGKVLGTPEYSSQMVTTYRILSLNINPNLNCYALIRF